MLQRMPQPNTRKKKPQRRTPPRRLRPHLLQVCLSDDERDALSAKLARYGISQSDLVRRWILQQPRKRVAKAQQQTPLEDPRQLTVAQHLSTSSD